ncbi:MAG: hypothetical protein GY784_05605 [Gammaproteobacteria bacterium]|nr:hypothetical protein [Gammaproteobacteria bacterium]
MQLLIIHITHITVVSVLPARSLYVRIIDQAGDIVVGVRIVVASTRKIVSKLGLKQ